MKKWEATPWEVAQSGKYMGPVEFQDHAGEWHVFHIVAVPGRLLFGGACNVGFLESGYFEVDNGIDNRDEALAELVADLETYYNEGPGHVARIVCNDRM